MLRTLTLGLLLATALAPAAGLADTAAQVKDCEGCHGNAGISEWSDVPTIAGISAGVHGDYLLSYKDKSRPCAKSKYRQGDTKRPETDMCIVAAKLSEADIDTLATYFAAKPFKAAKQTVDAAKAAAGKAIHARDCEKCHEGNGRKADADASILAGQWMPYLTAEMTAFVAGKRPQPKKMAEKMKGLKPADVEALAHFYASQQ
jgi:cytochrome subunit of sulfide dehydrogenase